MHTINQNVDQVDSEKRWPLRMHSIKIKYRLDQKGVNAQNQSKGPTMSGLGNSDPCRFESENENID